MNKSIKALSITSVALSCFSLLLAISVVTFLWKPLALLYSLPERTISEGAVVPLGNMVYVFGCVGVSILLFASNKSSKSIRTEAFSIVLLCVGLPLAEYYAHTIQYEILFKSFRWSTETIMSMNYTSNMLFLPLRIANLASMLCLIISGMRVSGKVCMKKGERTIKKLSVMAVIIALVFLIVSALLLTSIWEVSVKILYDLSESDINAGPIVPLGKMLYMVGVFISSVILVATFATKGKGKIEVILMIFLCSILPVLSWTFRWIQNERIAHLGESNILRLSLTENLLTFPIGIIGCVLGIVLVVCGMRIAYKKQRLEDCVEQLKQKG